MQHTLQQVKHSFLELAIGGIYQAIKGGSYMGGFILGACAIDTMGFLQFGNSNSMGMGSRYRMWCKKWLQPVNPQVNPKVLYELRSGLVHSYGYSHPPKHKPQAKITNYTYTRYQPERHWESDEEGHYTLNLETFVAEVTVAGYNFFKDLEADAGTRKKVLENAQTMVYVRDTSGIRTPANFEAIHPALAFLDGNQSPDSKKIEQLIKEGYLDYHNVRSRSRGVESPEGLDQGIFGLQEGLDTSGPR